MLKGISQKNRNRTWHTNHMARMKRRSILAAQHIVEKSLMKTKSKKAHEEYNKSQVEQKGEDKVIGRFERYWLNTVEFIKGLFSKKQTV